MKNKSIVFLDSGAGGLHILAECVKRLPRYEFVYIADTKNAPYGTKSKKQLQKIAIQIIEKVVSKHNPEIVVFACNTLTLNAIEKVREKFYKIKFVGVEPALKTAKIYGGNTIIFATKGTLKNYHAISKKINRELAKEYREQNLHFYNDDKIFKVSGENLPSIIDENLHNLNAVLPTLFKIFRDTKYQSCTNIVIGCTHFLGIKEQLNDIFPNIKFFDGVSSIVNQIYSLANYKKGFVLTPNLENDLEISKNQELKPRVIITTTDGNLEKQQSFEKYYRKIT